MTVGFSIQSEALIKQDKILLAGHKNLTDFLDFLKGHGVNSIEIRKLARSLEKKDYEAINRSVQMIWDMGFTITVHGDTEGEFNSGETFLEVYPTMAYILENYRDYQEYLTMTLHALQSDCATGLGTAELEEQTLIMLRDWIRFIEVEQLPIRFALENNRKKDSKADPGNSCENVLKMVEEIDSPHLGICWDMGHYYANVASSNDAIVADEKLPSEEFLRRVIHTHIHGTGKNGRTHFPIVESNHLAVEAYLAALGQCGYKGTYNLELSFKRYEVKMPVVEKVLASIEKLKLHEQILTVS